MLGKTVPAGGADMGILASRGVSDRGGSGRVVSVGAGLELSVLSLPSFSFSFSFSLSHSQLTSDRAVEGALSVWSPFSFSDSSVSVAVLLARLAVLALVTLLRALAVLLTVLALLVVLVRFRSDLPV